MRVKKTYCKEPTESKHVARKAIQKYVLEYRNHVTIPIAKRRDIFSTSVICAQGAKVPNHTKISINVILLICTCSHACRYTFIACCPSIFAARAVAEKCMENSIMNVSSIWDMKHLHENNGHGYIRYNCCDWIRYMLSVF